MTDKWTQLGSSKTKRLQTAWGNGADISQNFTDCLRNLRGDLTELCSWPGVSVLWWPRYVFPYPLPVLLCARVPVDLALSHVHPEGFSALQYKTQLCNCHTDEFHWHWSIRWPGLPPFAFFLLCLIFKIHVSSYLQVQAQQTYLCWQRSHAPAPKLASLPVPDPSLHNSADTCRSGHTCNAGQICITPSWRKKCYVR